MPEDFDDLLGGIGEGDEGAGMDDLLGGGGDDSGGDSALDDLLSQAGEASDSIDSEGLHAASFPHADEGESHHHDPAQMQELLSDVPVAIRVEFGRRKMKIRDILHLGPGKVVELDRSASDPVHIYCNNKLIGEGEIMVQKDESFCVRITKLYDANNH
ncbi:MAG: FliM/FliN family flagellar motor switch protein [Planctomycetes bacterium]|nr:FliM/FliN family flagellar motor switch protein [Planctomycetota bacterium]